jgi:hypothetical protein
MKESNLSNTEFLLKCEEIKKQKKWMSLFIDNFRLYQSEEIRYSSTEMSSSNAKRFKHDRLKELKNHDLLQLVSNIPDLNFIIFSGFEDTGLNNEIFSKIPSNVIAIYSCNSTIFGDKVFSLPYGLQRKLYEGDFRHDILKNMINENILPKKLLYINHNVNTNSKRIQINERFKNYSWCTIEKPKSIGFNDYSNYLQKIKEHKFMICPEGNAIGCDCHRDWEVIYMRRVPVVLDTQYLRNIFRNIPVLFVQSFDLVDKEILLKNDYLFEEMQNFDLSKLDIETIYNSILYDNKLSV